MKASRNLVAAVALLAAFSASPASAGWGDPIDSSPTVGFEDLVVMAEVGLQMALVAL